MAWTSVCGIIAPSLFAITALVSTAAMKKANTNLSCILKDMADWVVVLCDVLGVTIYGMMPEKLLKAWKHYRAVETLRHSGCRRSKHTMVKEITSQEHYRCVSPILNDIDIATEKCQFLFSRPHNSFMIIVECRKVSSSDFCMIK